MSSTYTNSNFSNETKGWKHVSVVKTQKETHLTHIQLLLQLLYMVDILSQMLNLSSSSLLLQVIAAAKQGFQASGFELNPWLVWYSRYKAWREGVHRSTSFHISDLWKVSHTDLYNNVWKDLWLDFWEMRLSYTEVLKGKWKNEIGDLFFKCDLNYYLIDLNT